MLNYIVIIACMLIISFGQVLFKTIGNRLAGESLLYFLEDKITALLLMAALSAYGVATIGWIWALRQTPLSTAYLFMSISFVIVPLCSYFIFRETLSVQYAIGCAMIVGGIIISSCS